MSKRQTDYLSAILGDMTPDTTPVPSPAQPASPSTARPASAAHAPFPSVPAPAEPPRNGMTLLSRESALARVATGEVRQVTQLLLDPARVRIWRGNPRHQESLTEANCRELIDAILAEGGQKVPAIVRRVSGDADHDYEVVAGSRRHWAISWLRANNYPEMAFLAQVYALDDESAFRISDIENRARKDVSDFERARVYLHALDAHYNGKQARMAERLRLSKGWLSKMLTVAALPDWLVTAFASPADIHLSSCYPLAQKVQALMHDDDKVAIARLQRLAGGLADDQAARRSGSEAPLGPAEVVARMQASGPSADAVDGLLKFDTAGGRTALSVLSSNRNGVSVRLHAGSGATEAELVKLLKSALYELEKQGRGLRL